jgi:hypothetical protein
MASIRKYHPNDLLDSKNSERFVQSAKPQATSHKQQAASNKPQAPSSKAQAASREPQAT